MTDAACEAGNSYYFGTPGFTFLEDHCLSSKDNQGDQADSKQKDQGTPAGSAPSQTEYTISVKTGDRKGAGTDANVSCILHNDDGQSTDKMELDKMLRNDFESGQKDDFKVTAKYLTKVDTIEVWRDDQGGNDEWFVESVLVTCEEYDTPFVFPFLRWVKEGYRYKIRHLDTCLPQHDPHKEQRLMELKDKKAIYEMEVKVPGLPIQVKNIPDDEVFSNEYQFDMTKQLVILKVQSKVAELTSGRWESLDDMENIYTDTVLTKPTCLANGTWDTDEHFGYQRLGGLNNSVITLCTEIPEKLAVTPEMLEPFLEGATLHDVMSMKKLFYVDLAITDGMPTKDGYTVCSPVALFYQNKKSVLVPIAIQLKQQPAEDNPVFLPSDPHYTWLSAKLWFNHADSSYHQCISHLGFTHLIMEGCVLVTHRNLSHSHPIFKLLASHFIYLVAIDTFGLQVLINENGLLDRLMSIGISGAFDLIKRKLAVWRLDEDGTLPVDMEKRGVLDPDVLQGYHYRDDALPLYNAIKTYVTSYVQLYYESPEIYIEDHELQAWAHALVRPRSQGGCGLLGVPGDGVITKETDLVLILTSIIFTVSASHAAVNFGQYEQYGFPPNYPSAITGDPPSDKSALTEQCILDALPDKEQTLDMMSLAKLLSTMGTNKLGDYEVKYIYDPKAEDVLVQFQNKLLELTKRGDDVDEGRTVSYKWLNPRNVPNSISI